MATDLETRNWYYARDRKKAGPVPWGQLRTLAITGQLRPTDMVLHDGTLHWTEACSVPGLFPPVARLLPDGPAAHGTATIEGVPLAVPLTMGALPPTASWRAHADATEKALPVPTLPGYSIRAELGRGGMGVVYLAEQLALKRPVALKMVLGGVVAGSHQLERFRAEAETIARLQNPNIVQVYEVGEHDSLPYFSLEYCAGGSLAQRLDGTPLPAREAAALVETLARAMHAAHERGIVHRDLKPANILYTGDGTPKITDFGLAKDLDASAKLTQSGAIMGTPSYMPPEQALGRIRELGPAADIYSLGAVLYELLTGRPPFKGATPMDTMMQAAKDEPVAPSRLQPKVPLDVETMCLKCLEKSAVRRYATAQALADDLHRFLAGEPIQARPAGRIERSWKWARRRPAAAALIGVSALALLIVLIGGAYFTVQLSLERDAAVAAQRKAERERQRADQREIEIRLQQAKAEQARRSLLTGQVWRVSSIWDRDPFQALQLLEDPNACPPELRDFSWRYYHALCQQWEPSLLKGHGNSVHAVAAAPDGKLIASGSHDGTIKLWDLATRKERTLRGHAGPVLTVAFSPDGAWLASGGADRSIRTWDVASAQPAGPALTGHTGVVYSLAFSPDGKRLVSGSGNLDPKEKDRNLRMKDGEVRLWDLAARKEERLLLPRQKEAVLSVDYSRDGRLVAAGITHGGWVFLFDASTGKTVDKFAFGGGWVHSVRFSPDSRTLACGTARQVVYLRDVAVRHTRLILRGHQAEVHGVAWSPDGQSVASGDSEGRVKLWDPNTGQERLALRHDRSGVLSLVFNPTERPTERSLVAGDGAGTVTIWGLACRPAWKTYEDPFGFSAVAISADSGTLAGAAREKTVRLWDFASGKERTLPLGNHGALALAFAPRGSLLAVGVQSIDGGGRPLGRGECQIWDTHDDRKVATLTASDRPITAVTFTPEGRVLLTGDTDGFVRIWDVAGQRGTAAPLGRHRGAVTALAVSPDGRTLASAADDTLKLWDLAERRERPALQAGPALILCLGFLDDGRTLASAGSERTVKLWDVETATLRTTLPAQQAGVLSLAVSADGQTLALGCQDRTVQLWDVRSGQLRAVLTGHTREVNGVAFSRDGRLLISGSASNAAFWVKTGEVKVWRADP